MRSLDVRPYLCDFPTCAERGCDLHCNEAIAPREILTLPLKGQYFDEIKALTKPEEFRLVTPYWKRRIEGRTYKAILLTRGYPSRSDAERRMFRPWRGYSVQTITHPHFGPDPVQVFAIVVNETGGKP